MIKVYDIINNPISELYEIGSIPVDVDNLDSIDSIVEVLNEYLKMDKLASECVYTLSMTFAAIPKGILFISCGTCDMVQTDLKKLATGLLLTGAEQFMCFHNHPGGSREISYNDMEMTNKYKAIGDLLGIKFLGHYMVTQGYYESCGEVDESKYVFGTEVE